MSYFYLIRFRIRKIDFSYLYATLVKVSVKANGLQKKKPLQPLWRCNGRAQFFYTRSYVCRHQVLDESLLSLYFTHFDSFDTV